MFRSKTVKRGQKKPTPVTGPITPVSASTTINVVNNVSDISGSAVIPKQEISTESMLSALLDAESKNAVHRPWLRLERGVRMRLLRAFVEKQKDLSNAERVELLASLVEALDKKLLNSKSQIAYNQDIGEITDINSLKITKTAGKMIFRVEPPNRSTKKAKRALSASDSD